MEHDGEPFSAWVYSAIKPKKHLEVGSWEGFGALLCLKSCEAEVWAVNQPEGETVALGGADCSKPRVGERVVSQAVVVAFGVRADGHRAILATDVGHSETEPFWKDFLTQLTDRGLHGVHLVISDAHKRLNAAIQVT